MHYGAQPKPEARDKTGEVPGVGNVSFPGGMSDDKIAEAIKSYLAQHKPDFIPKYAVQSANTHDRAAADDPTAEFTLDVRGTDGVQTVNADKTGAISSIQHEGRLCAARQTTINSGPGSRRTWETRSRRYYFALLKSWFDIETTT